MSKPITGKTHVGERRENGPMAIFTFMNESLPMMKKLKRPMLSVRNSRVKLSRELKK